MQSGGRSRLLTPPKLLSPPTRYIKMNIDDIWNSDRRVAGFGIMVKGDTGNFVAVKCSCFEDAFSSFQAEAIAAKEGLIWAVNKGFQKSSIC